MIMDKIKNIKIIYYIINKNYFKMKLLIFNLKLYLIILKNK